VTHLTKFWFRQVRVGPVTVFFFGRAAKFFILDWFRATTLLWINENLSDCSPVDPVLLTHKYMFLITAASGT